MHLSELIQLLACPVDHAPLRMEDDMLVCTSCARRYPIINGIPSMLVEDTGEAPATAEPCQEA